jgi:hypothetical protein
MVIFIENSHSWKDFMQRKTLKHLDVSRQKSRVATDLKSDRVRLVETIPFFQGSTAESQTSDGWSDTYNEDGPFSI